MPPTLGQRLKHAREKRGLSLRDIEHTTRIPVARLQDLEEDKLNTFGGMAYAKSFLKAYAHLLDVNAEEVLNQMKPPPLSGARDYRYLVESQGPWIRDRGDRAFHGPGATLGPGKSFLFAVMVCFAFAVLVGGGVLANAYFNSKPAGAAKSGEREAKPVPITSADEVQLSGSQQEEPEFELRRATIMVQPDPVVPAPVPPKAQPVNEAPTVPPKAQPVR